MIVATSGFEISNKEVVCFNPLSRYLPAIQAKEDIRCEEGNSLVSVDKGLIQSQRLEQQMLAASSALA